MEILYKDCVCHKKSCPETHTHTFCISVFARPFFSCVISFLKHSPAPYPYPNYPN